MQKTERLRPEVEAILGIMLLTAVLIAAACAGISAGGIWPKADGQVVKSGGSLKIDASHMDDGYVMASGPSTKKRLKLRVRYGEETQIYDLNGNQDYEVIPLQFGSGSYSFSLYQNTSGNRYSEVGVLRLNAEMPDEDAPFICPNQYIQYDQDTPAVIKSCELCEDSRNDQEKFDAISRYLEDNFVYDYVKAATASPGAKPDIDRCFQRRMGICQDLSAMLVCMLRVQGIPAKMIVGYANDEYHAWVIAKVSGNEVFYDPTVVLKAVKRNVVYTAERFY